MFGWDPRLGARDNRLPEECIWFERLSFLYGYRGINDGLPGRKIPVGHAVPGFLHAVSGQEWQVLFLMLGTNDLLDSGFRSPDRIGQRWDAALAALLERFPERKDRIVLATCPYAPVFPGDLTEEIRRGYRVMAEKYGVSFFDALDPLPALYDGIHLSEEGHRILAERAAAFLSRFRTGEDS